jgi:hypothetical protein
MFVPQDEVRLQWDEPPFFTFRTVGLGGLLLRGAVFLGFCVLFAFALAAEVRSGQPRGLLECVILVLVTSTVLTAVVTAPSIQRRVTITPKDITWGNRYPASLLLGLLSLGALTRPEIRAVVLRRAREEGNRLPYGIMTVELKYARPAVFAVPNKLPLESVAQVLHDNGIPVTLTRWSSEAPSGSAVGNGPA